MKSRAWKLAVGGCLAGSVLECGSPLPLSPGGEPPAANQSARGLAHAKTWRLRTVCFCFLLSAFWLPALGQSYSIDWFTIDGGGGTSTNGQYSVSGTIGQPDAGNMSGGNYTLQGGFWGVVAAVQTPGAPRLTITPAGPNVIISWPSPSSGFGLQENPDLNPANWSAVPSTNNDNGTIKSITVPARPGNRFYRLKK